MSDELLPFCPQCGSPGDGHRFCGTCGGPLLRADVNPAGASPAPAPDVEQTAALPVAQSVPPSAVRPTWAPPVEPPQRNRNRVLVPITIGLALLLAVGAGLGGYLWWQGNEDEKSARAAELAQAQANERAASDRERELATQKERLEREDAAEDAAAERKAAAERERAAADRARERERAAAEAALARSADPLGLGIDLSPQYCSGEYLVILASSGDPAAYVSTLRPAYEQAGGEAKYLRTSDSCGSFTQKINGNDVYAAFLGPFDSAWQACEARGRIGFGGSYVRELRSDQDRRTPCACEYSASELPRISRGDGGSAEPATGLFVSDAKSLLYSAGHNKRRDSSSSFDAAMDGWVREFQNRSSWLASDGIIGPDTWSELISYCGRDPQE